MTRVLPVATAARPCAASGRRPARYVDALVWTGLCLIPLICRPDTASAFFVPKLFALAVLSLAVAGWCALRWSELLHVPVWPPLVWTAAVSVSALASSQVSLPALLLALCAVPLFWAGAAATFGSAVAAAAVFESAVVLLQYAGADPLRWLGWQAETFANPRMRVYGALGNPDFVAAWCCAALPLSYLCFVQHARGKRAAACGWCAVAALLAAILATGSRAAVPGFAAVALILVVCGGRRWRAALAVLPVSALVLWMPGSRPLAETLAGRLHLAQVSLSGVGSIPLTGTGPGSFEAEFARRQAVWLSRHPDEVRFAAPVDHAHNDYAEILVEYGPLGLAALLAILGLSIRAFRLGPDVCGSRTAAAAGLAALAAVACIDFPLHRPAEWALFWLLLGTVYSAHTQFERTSHREDACSSHENRPPVLP